MPAYDGKTPVAQVSQTLTAEEYARGALLVSRQASPLARPGVRAGVCVMAGAIAACTAPASLREYGSMWLPLLFILLFLALACWFWFFQPERELEGMRREFRQSPVLGLASQLQLYRDYFILRDEYEEITEYWTDFSECFEDGEFFAVSGGTERPLLLVKKEGLSPEEKEALQVHFQNAFAVRYRLVKGKGGRRGESAGEKK